MILPLHSSILQSCPKTSPRGTYWHNIGKFSIGQTYITSTTRRGSNENSLRSSSLWSSNKLHENKSNSQLSDA